MGPFDWQKTVAIYSHSFAHQPSLSLIFPSKKAITSTQLLFSWQCLPEEERVSRGVLPLIQASRAELLLNTSYGGIGSDTDNKDIRLSWPFRGILPWLHQSHQHQDELSRKEGEKWKRKGCPWYHNCNSCTASHSSAKDRTSHSINWCRSYHGMGSNMSNKSTRYLHCIPWGMELSWACISPRLFFN